MTNEWRQQSHCVSSGGVTDLAKKNGVALFFDRPVDVKNNIN